ncbi:apiosidase-like domain-containing protein [Isoptericola aurantiacus]|uniref:apiosidase-like domain-containing protein n=1 Tax=Isoptericola aurantiacus TaxID=3377839 RepID=UPI00383BBB08
MRRLIVVLVLVAVALGGAAVVYRELRPATPTQDGWYERPPAAGAPLRSVEPSTARSTADGRPRFVTAVSADGRSFVDQDGTPILVAGDAPWSLLVDLLPDEAETYLTARSDQGFNTLVVSLLGNPANGGPSADGATVDGLLPFADGDVTRWNAAYWDRAHATLERAAELGLTVLLYPVDSWTIDEPFGSPSVDVCREYGAMVGAWAADLPNILWMAGGDYTPDADDDACLEAVQAGIRSTGDDRPFSAQLISVRFAGQDPHWGPLVDWDFVYTYQPVYEAVREAYDAAPVRPALLGETNYEGENNMGDEPTTTETLRRQVLWAITSGSPGDVYGTDDWEFLPGWQDRLHSQGAQQVARIRDVVASLPWWTLVPDSGDLLTGGIGGNPDASDQLETDLATAAVSPDGDLALVYVPTDRTITLDVDRLAEGAGAWWVDPTTGEATSTNPAATMTTPGANAGGDHDWLLVLGTHAVG